MTRSFLGTSAAAPIPLLTLVLALGGCGQQARANPPSQASLPPSASVAAAEPTAAQPGTPLPPAPVPATFDVAALADR